MNEPCSWPMVGGPVSWLLLPHGYHASPLTRGDIAPLIEKLGTWQTTIAPGYEARAREPAYYLRHVHLDDASCPHDLFGIAARQGDELVAVCVIQRDRATRALFQRIVATDPAHAEKGVLHGLLALVACIATVMRD